MLKIMIQLKKNKLKMQEKKKNFKSEGLEKKRGNVIQNTNVGAFDESKETLPIM